MQANVQSFGVHGLVEDEALLGPSASDLEADDDLDELDDDEDDFDDDELDDDEDDDLDDDEDDDDLIDLDDEFDTDDEERPHPGPFDE